MNLGVLKLYTGSRLASHIGALLRRPSLLVEAVRSGWALRRHGRPYPSKAYLKWRIQTAYGNSDAAVSTSDLVHFLEWRRQMRRIRSWGEVL